MCLTDGDDESLRLTLSNVEANLPTRTILKAKKEKDQDRPHHHQQRNTHTAAAAAAEEEEDSGEEIHPSPVPVMTVRKLRWGCAADIATALHDDGGDGDISNTYGWDIVLGSDIAAFPYASSFGDLLRTIVALVFAGDHRVIPGTTTAKIPTYPGNPDPESGSGRGRRVLVLISHKRRHVSEDAFFETLESELGEKEYCRLPTQADDVHVDFRDEGITIHKYQIDLLPH